VIQDGHGLGNVRRRLDTMYGAAGSIEVLPAASGRGTIARLRVPVGGPQTDGAAGTGGP
jgi:LytS/YehU family sensor histidine kinase